MNRYSFSTAALFPLESDEALRRIARAGFAQAELMPQAVSDVSEDKTRLYEKSGARVVSIHLPLWFFPWFYTPHKTMMADGRAYAEKLLVMAKRLGTEVLVVHPHEKNRAGHEALLEAPIVDNLRWLAERCGQAGVTMALENNPKSCATAEQLLAYAEALGSPFVKPMVDVTEVCEAGGDPVRFLRAFTPCHLHLSDYAGASRHLPPGEGDIDWQGVKNALAGFTGVYTLEPSYRYYLDDVDEKLARARDFITGLLEGA